MIKAHVITVVRNTSVSAEVALGVTFNDWAVKNPDARVFHLFDPVRTCIKHGSPNDTEYFVSMTFFYEPRRTQREVGDEDRAQICG